ncbi:MAG: maleylacetoacetate isomerase [Pseudomonadota bacterium]
MFELHDFGPSVASYRVRIALNLKGISYEKVPVSLILNGGEHHAAEYRSLNPQGLLPTFSDNHVTLTQSLAIIEYLEETYPEPTILPGSPILRAKARQIAHITACDIQPLLGLRVLGYLRTTLQVSNARRANWFLHWLMEGLDALELLLSTSNNRGKYALSDEITLADICIVPQLYAARRFKLPLDDFPRLEEIEKACLQLPAFSEAEPQFTGP